MNWLPATASDETKLPPRPGIRRRIYADVCRHCGSVHMDVAEAVKCRESALGRSQD